MTAVTWIMRRSKLSRLVNQPGGVTVAAALAEAAEQTREFRVEAERIVLAAFDELDGLLAAPPAPADAEAWLDKVYFLATRMSDTAGPFGFADMCAAALSLCELADRQKRAGRPHLPPLRVHAAALRLLFSADQPAEASRAVLAGLAQVVDKAARPAG